PTRVHKSQCYSRPAVPTAGNWRREPEGQSVPITRADWRAHAKDACAVSEGVHHTVMIKDGLYTANAATYAAKQRSFCVERLSRRACRVSFSLSSTLALSTRILAPRRQMLLSLRLLACIRRSVRGLGRDAFARSPLVNLAAEQRERGKAAV